MTAVADIGNRVGSAVAAGGVRDEARIQRLLVLRFLVLSVIHLFIGTVQGVIQTFPNVAQWLREAGPAGHLIDPLAHAHINLVGGVTMGMMGLIYYVLPKVMKRGIWSPVLSGASFWLSTGSTWKIFHRSGCAHRMNSIMSSSLFASVTTVFILSRKPRSCTSSTRP